MTAGVADTVRQAIDADDRMVNAIATEDGVQPIHVWGFLRGSDARVSTINRLCDVLALGYVEEEE